MTKPLFKPNLPAEIVYQKRKTETLERAFMQAGNLLNINTAGLSNLDIDRIVVGGGYEASPPDGKMISDEANGLILIRQEGNWVTTSSRLVSELPVSTHNGQEICYQNENMAESGVEWQFIYREASGSPYKWEFVGGPELHSEEVAQAAVVLAKTDFTWQALTKTPVITLPLSGEYTVVMVAEYVQRTTAGLGQFDLSVGVAPSTPVTNAAVYVATTQWDSSSQSIKWAPGAMSAGTVLKILANGNIAEGFSVGSTYVGVLPVRVG